jgi:hypothetical protein
MADGVFNIAKGRVAEFFYRVDSNDPSTSGFKVVLLKSSGLEAEDTLNNYDTISALLAGTNDEADFTNYARKTLTDSDITMPAPDDGNNRIDLDIADQTWTTAGGATNNTLGKLVIVYFPDTSGADTTGIPCTYHDFSVTTDGSDLTAQIASAGFFRAA